MDALSKGDEKDAFILVNITEELVKQKAKEMMPSYEMCQCTKCYYDICAIALNNMKPQYVTTNKGSLLAMITTGMIDYQTDLTVSVLHALLHVKASPRH